MFLLLGKIVNVSRNEKLMKCIYSVQNSELNQSHLVVIESTKFQFSTQPVENGYLAVHAAAVIRPPDAVIQAHSQNTVELRFAQFSFITGTIQSKRIHATSDIQTETKQTLRIKLPFSIACSTMIRTASSIAFIGLVSSSQMMGTNNPSRFDAEIRAKADELAAKQTDEIDMNFRLFAEYHGPKGGPAQTRPLKGVRRDTTLAQLHGLIRNQFRDRIPPLALPSAGTRQDQRVRLMDGREELSETETAVVDKFDENTVIPVDLVRVPKTMPTQDMSQIEEFPITIVFNVQSGTGPLGGYESDPDVYSIGSVTWESTQIPEKITAKLRCLPRTFRQPVSGEEEVYDVKLLRILKKIFPVDHFGVALKLDHRPHPNQESWIALITGRS